MNFGVADDRWYTDAPDDLIARLVQRRANVNLIRTVLFSRVVGQARSACAATRAFQETVRRLDEYPPGAIATVMGTPWFDHWVYLADNVRRRYERGEEVLDRDLPSYGGFGPTGDRVVWMLKDFGRFVLELAILTGSALDGCVVAWDGEVPLGLWGLSFPVPSSGELPARVTVERGRIGLRLGTTSWDATALHRGRTEDLRETEGAICAPRLRLRNSEIHVSAMDPLARREWIDVYVNPDGTRYLPPGDLVAFSAGYQAGLDLLHITWPRMADDVATGLHAILPVGRPGPERGVSCSSDTFFRAILCCDNPPVLAAEVLVHEFGHNVFNEMLARDSVFAGGAPPAEVLYSPWREDPRPVLGCFHSAFVFERVCQMYRLYLDANAGDDGAFTRFRMLLGCLRVACGLIARAGGYGPVGARILDGISRRAEHMASSSRARLLPSEKEAIRQHFAGWSAQNPDLAERNAFVIPD